MALPSNLEVFKFQDVFLALSPCAIRRLDSTPDFVVSRFDLICLILINQIV